jgi:hypothetical protein
MLQVGMQVGQKESCVDLMESYSSLTRRGIKLLKPKGGNTMIYKCNSFGEQSNKCDCPFSVQFGRKHEKNKGGDDADVWFISKKNFCVEHDGMCSDSVDEQLQQQLMTITSKDNVDGETLKRVLDDNHYTKCNSRLKSLLAMRLLLNVYMDIDE